MNIIFNVDFKERKFHVFFEGKLPKCEIDTSQFLLNRDFFVNELICDSDVLNVDNVKKKAWVDEEYEVALYTLQENTEHVKINYTGYLTGKTGLCPYVREKINPNFTFIRFETFPYPIFSSIDMKEIRKFLHSSIEFNVKIIVPSDFSVLSTCKLINKSLKDSSAIYEFKGYELNFAIAKYECVKLPVGKFYFFNNATEDTKNIINETIRKTYKFMNATFGEREIDSDVEYVCIPNKFGSFARKTCIFIDEVSFESKEKMEYIIHEFIHLGWNAKTDSVTQRIRFFDEAFTSYFTLRVQEYLLGTDDFNYKIDRIKSYYKDKIKDMVPIIDYGKYECGDFSYTIGALCLHELCEFVGRDVFDNATKIFLEKYRYIPSSMENLCEEYIALCDCKELKGFFEDWIYSVKGICEYISK